MRKLLIMGLLLTAATQANAWGLEHCKAATSVKALYGQSTLVKHCHQYIRKYSRAGKADGKYIFVEDRYPEYKGQWGLRWYVDIEDTSSVFTEDEI